MAKLSLPKLEFDKKKAGIAGGALLVAVAGWFAWDMFMAEPPPPPPKPQPPAVTEKPAEGEKKGDATADAKPVVDGAPAAKPAGDATPAKKPVAADAPAAKTVAGKVPAMKAPSAPDMAAPVDSGPRMLTARSKLDARECLKHETNQAIQQCAERFR